MCSRARINDAMTRTNKQFALAALIAVLLWALHATAQNAPQTGATPGADRVVVPLSDPTQPVVLKASLLNGSITVKAHASNQVIVEARARGERRESGAADGGKRRIMITTTGLTVEEENNQVEVTADSIHRTIDLTVLVPVRTSVNLRTINEGNIIVTGIDGEIDVNNVNGEVTLQDISGYAIAHSLNGELKANFKRVNPQKPMAFSSLNGDIDVTFPADLKANVSVASERGDVYSDFDIQLQARPSQVESVRDKQAKFRVRIDKTVRGTINGGGQEIQFKNFQGEIYIRRIGASKGGE